MFQLILGITIAALALFYLYLRKSLKKENPLAVSAPNPPAVSEDVNLPAVSEDINLPILK